MSVSQCARALVAAAVFMAVSVDAQDPYMRVNPFCATPVDATTAPVMWSAWAGKPANLNTTVTVVPCGTWVVLDQSVSNLRGLDIQGKLTVSTAQDITLHTQYVLNRGQLEVGAPGAGHPKKFNVRLFGGSSALVFDGSSQGGKPAVDGGFKAFVTYGGTTRLYGLPSTITTTKTKLHRTAAVKSTFIVVKGDVSAQWRVGDNIAIAATANSYKQSENRTIVAMTASVTDGVPTTTIALNTILNFNHNVTSVTITDNGTPVTHVQSAEVALLSRNIRIEGVYDPASPNTGGHFMVMHTKSQQIIDGVELFYMGQSGVLGRYPLHLHWCGFMNTNGAPLTLPMRNTLSRNAIWNSNQRCVVVHSTHDALVSDNTAYFTHGHCYMLEDGVESNNIFDGNLGMYTEEAKALIITADGENDNDASTYWIIAPNNTFTNNVAAGARNSGFWFDTKPTVRGASINLPEGINLVPKTAKLLMFSGNTAHSNPVGLRTYPKGYQPASTATFKSYTAWGNSDGWFSSGGTRNMVIDQGLFINNANFAVNLNRANNILVQNTVVVGQVTPPSNKNCSQNSALTGIRFSSYSTNERLPNRIDNVRFFNFPTPAASCRPSVQALWFAKRSMDGFEFWMATTRVSNLKFDASVSKRAFFTSPSEPSLNNSMGPVAVWDGDNSLSGIGGSGSSYLLSTNVAGTSDCLLRTDFNALVCASKCYRSVFITYTERNNVKTQLKIENAALGMSTVIDGPINTGTPAKRFFTYQLRSGMTVPQDYTITAVLRNTNGTGVVPPESAPLDYKVDLADVGAAAQCGGLLAVNIALRLQLGVAAASEIPGIQGTSS